MTIMLIRALPLPASSLEGGRDGQVLHPRRRIPNADRDRADRLPEIKRSAISAEAIERVDDRISDEMYGMGSG